MKKVTMKCPSHEVLKKCAKCDGTGRVSVSLDEIELDRRHTNYHRLYVLQRDAKRIVMQANELKRMRPDKEGTYQKQLEPLLGEINAEADVLMAEL